jgi:hypothetical protein
MNFRKMAVRVAAKSDDPLKSHGEDWAENQPLDDDEEIVAYVLRLDETHWGTTAFEETVGENLKKKPPTPVTEQELMRQFPNKGMSLWMDGEGGDPLWISTADPNFSASLHEMEIWPGNGPAFAN